MVQNPLIVALDLPTLRAAEVVVKRLKKHVTIFKIGLQLFTREGPKVVQMVQRHGGEVFLDLKFHDIPNTVAQACESATRLRVAMMTLHVSGGLEMLQRAVASTRSVAKSIKCPKPHLLGVTVLTSTAPTAATKRQVRAMAQLAQEAGLDGVVCAATELSAVRRVCGPKLLLVTPGIRPAGDAHGDQKRVMTPKEAIDLGANYLVMGRPILESRDPVGVCRGVIHHALHRVLPGYSS